MGGKQRLVSKLLPLIPDHRVYCEPFAGSAALLLNKPPSPIEVLNDLDGNLVNLFLVVRDRADEFIERCVRLPYSRELYDTWRRPFLERRTNEPADPVERAVRFFYVVRSAFFSHPQKGWRFSLKTTEPDRIQNTLSEVRKIAQRLRKVYIDRLDFRRCITNWDSPETFFFVDPPYYGVLTQYLYPLREQEHLELAELLKATEGKWLLTYNDTTAIRKLYARYPKQRVRQPLASYKPKRGENRPVWSQLIIRNYELPHTQK